MSTLVDNGVISSSMSLKELTSLKQRMEDTRIKLEVRRLYKL